jgi:hypothetical protein
MSDEELMALQERNAERAANAIASMGTKYACHPANLVKAAPDRANFIPAAERRVYNSPVVLLRKGGGK